jgi:energy-coupling factor transporter transmembrane protein EcfT
MNREAVPLLIGIMLPILFVALIVLYLYGYDITVYLKKIDIIYYIVLIPFALGFLVIIFWFRNPKE